MGKCQNCGSGITKEDLFCPDCGIKRNIPKESINNGAIHSKTFKISAIILGIIMLLFIFIPTRTHSYQIAISYQTMENYTEKEPYQIQEKYTKLQPYEDTETYYENISVQQSVPHQVADFQYDEFYEAPEGQYYPKWNEFKCICNQYTRFGSEIIQRCIQLKCQETKYKTIYQNESVQQQITKQRSVTKYKAVTDYRNVTMYNSLEKIRNVTKTRVESMDVQQNWIFGFNVPWKLNIF